MIFLRPPRGLHCSDYPGFEIAFCNVPRTMDLSYLIREYYQVTVKFYRCGRLALVNCQDGKKVFGKELQEEEKGQRRCWSDVQAIRVNYNASQCEWVVRNLSP